MTPVIIIGAGIAGLACACRLADAGMAPVVLDKGRGIGGRVSESLGTAPWPMAALANAGLIAQFLLAHSLLLTGTGGRFLAQLIPGPHGRALVTTTYAIIASVQLLALSALWTPSGVVWWRAEGAAFWAMTTAYAAIWLILLKASFDAGAEVQSGALGWMSLLARIRPVFPDMPISGLFRLIRQPIYVRFR